jgi:nicotinamidase/pyrazinamidase
VDISPNDALIVVDVQNDFCAGGALEVPAGDDVVEVINRLMPNFAHVIATQDYHPPGHSSFTEQGGRWPVHCVQGTTGAEFHPGLEVAKVDDVARKGTDVATDGYSGFAGTDLAERLRARGVTRVLVTGLATDYCVRATVLEAIENGFEAVVVSDAIAAVGASPGDGDAAVAEMRDAGATLVGSDRINS